MPRPSDRQLVLAAQVAGGLERHASPIELVQMAGGRADILSGLLRRAERGSSMQAPVPEHVERMRAAVASATGADR